MSYEIEFLEALMALAIVLYTSAEMYNYRKKESIIHTGLALCEDANAFQNCK